MLVSRSSPAPSAPSPPAQRGRRDRRRVQRHLVGPRAQERADVLERPDTAAHGQWHVDALGGPAHHLQHDRAALVGGRDVEEHELVRPLLIIGLGSLPGIARPPPPPLKCPKRTPLPTRPALTSRQGISRLQSMARAHPPTSARARRRSTAPLEAARPTRPPPTPTLAA